MLSPRLTSPPAPKPASVSCFGFRHSDFRGHRRGFTLTEILVVIVIIVLILGMAVPALRFITGSRSQAGAANMISAMLARARNDAIGLQVPTGVCIYTDATGRTQMAEVQQIKFSPWNDVTPYPVGSYVSYTPGSGVTEYFVCIVNVPPTTSTNAVPAGNTSWAEIADNNPPTKVVSTSPGFPNLFDQVVGTDAEPLPSGVGAMVVIDQGSHYNGGAGPPYPQTANTQDRYLPLGLVVFDANGRLIVQPYWLSQFGIVGSASGFGSKKYDVAQNYGSQIAGALDLADALTHNAPSNPTLPTTLFSSIGLATFDREALASQNPAAAGPIDLMIDAATYGAVGTLDRVANQDDWLDKNATPLLVNRYNGTLLRSE